MLDLLHPGTGPRASYNQLKHHSRRPDQPFDGFRGRQGQSQQSAYRGHVDPLGLGDLGGGGHPLIVEQPLPMAGQPECTQQRAVLQPFTVFVSRAFRAVLP